MEVQDTNDDNKTLGSFQTLIHGLTSKKQQQRDPRALRLAAVTAAVVELAGKEQLTASQVYAKAVTALEGTLSSEKQLENIHDSLATQVALLELLSVTLPHVKPAGILRATLPLTSRVLRAIVESCQEVSSDVVLETKDELGGVNAALCGLCRSTAQFLLRLEPDTDYTAVQQLYMATIVRMFDDRRPKVRKAAQSAATEILAQSEHPVFRKATTKFFHSALVKTQRGIEKQGSAALEGETSSSLLHLISTLERCILNLDFEMLSKDVMELLTLLFQLDATSAASDFVSMVKVNRQAAKSQGLIIQSLLAVVLHALEEGDEDGALSTVITDWSSRVLATLLTAKPSLIFRSGAAQDEILDRGRILYGRAVIASMKRVIAGQGKNSNELACRMFPISIQMIVLLCKPSDFEDSPEPDTTVADTLLVDLTQLFRLSLKQLIAANPAELEKFMKGSLDGLAIMLRTEYRSCWSVALKPLVVFLHHVVEMKEAADCLELLLQQRNKMRSGSPSQRYVDDAFSTFVQGVGIEKAWPLIKWQPPGQEGTSGIGVERGWILSTMKSAALTAQPDSPKLAFFQEIVLGFARICDRLATTTKESTFQKARVVDLWSLLHCFCKGPSDIPTSLPPLATILGKALEDERYPQLVNIISRALSVLCETVAGSDSEKDADALREASKKLLPILFEKITSFQETSTSGKGDSMAVDTPQKSDSTSYIGQQIQVLSDAIAQLARHAPAQFLHSLFKKLMHKLLDEVQSESRNEERLCCFLSLSQALVASETLDESSISFLYRTLKPFIRNDETGARCQKKAYKVLSELCERNHELFVDLDRLKELTELLTGTTGSSQVAARHMRLKCLKHIVDGLNESQTDCLTEIGCVLAETLLCLKDNNGKTREAAYQLLLAMASKIKLIQFVHTLTAALGAETSHMRSAAVMGLSRIVFEFAWEDESLQGLLPSLLSTVLILINENSREVIKSVIGFIRVSVAAIRREQLEPLLPDLIKSLMGYQEGKDRFRAKIKIILKKLVKLFGYDKLMPIFPQSDARLLTHMRKLDERHKRRKEALKQEGIPDKGAFDEMVESDEEDSDEGRTLATGATGLTKMTGRSAKSSRTAKGEKSVSSKTKKSLASGSAVSSGRKQLPSIQLPDETDGEVVDMLGANMAKKVKFMEEDLDNDSGSEAAMEFDDEGRLLIHDEPSEARKADSFEERANKKQRTSKFESAKISRNKKNETGKKNSSRQLGAAYKSKKAGGDVKRKDQKYEPYAFVPLDGKSYSKKNRRSAVESMSTVVRQGKKRKQK